MFEKNKFAQIIKNIKETYSSQEEFSQKSDIGRTYLSQYMNMKLKEPPKPKILEKLAKASNGVTTYKELMDICGYSKKNIENTVYEIYQQLKELNQAIFEEPTQYFHQTEDAIYNFQIYSSDLLRTLEKKETTKILLTSYYKKSFFLQDYSYIATFLFLYEAFIKCLEKNLYIALEDYKYTDWFNKDDFYKKITDIQYLENFEFLSYTSTNIIFIKENLKDVFQYINNFTTYLNLAYLSEFESNTLTELFKKKAQNKDDDKLECNNETCSKNNITNNKQLYMTPVYRSHFSRYS